MPLMDQPAFAAVLRALINAALEAGVLHFGHAFGDGAAEKYDAPTVSRVLRKYRHTDRG